MSKFNLILPVNLFIVGAPGSGKSHLVSYLLSYFTNNKTKANKFEYGLLFTKTKFNGAYEGIIPKQWTYTSFSETAIRNLMKHQAKIRTQGYKPPNAFILFDDFLKGTQMRKQIITDLYANYRHFNISIIYACQRLASVISTAQRDFTSYAFIFRSKSTIALNTI